MTGLDFFFFFDDLDLGDDDAVLDLFRFSVGAFVFGVCSLALAVEANGLSTTDGLLPVEIRAVSFCCRPVTEMIFCSYILLNSIFLHRIYILVVVG